MTDQFPTDLASPPRDLLVALIRFAKSEFPTIYVKFGDEGAIRALRIRFEEMVE